MGTQCGWEQIQRPPNSPRSAVPCSAEADLPADGTALLHCVPAGLQHAGVDASQGGLMSPCAHTLVCFHVHAKIRQNSPISPPLRQQEALMPACTNASGAHGAPAPKAAATREDIAPVTHSSSTASRWVQNELRLS